jgi:hypothetical protein
MATPDVAELLITLNGPDRRGERRFLPWPYYNSEG